MRCVLLAALLVPATALAAPVVYVGDSPVEAAERVKGLAGGNLSELEPVSWDVVRGRPASLLEGGASTSCRGEPATVEDVRAAVGKATSDLFYGDLEAASAAIETAEGQVVCASEVVPADLLGETHFVSGAIVHAGGDRDGATARFIRARMADPDRAWDERFPGTARPIFDAAVPGDGVPLRVVAPNAEGVWIDGAAAREASLGPGVHLVQVDGKGWWVDVRPGSKATFVVPSAFPAEAIGWTDDEARGADLSALLGITLGEGVAVWVVDGDTVVRGTTGRSDWAVATGRGAGRGTDGKRNPGPVIAAVGGGVTVAGALLAVTAIGTANNTVRAACSVTADEEYAELEERLAGANQRERIGWGIAAGGAAVVVAGVVVTLVKGRTVSVAPTLTGVTVRGRF